MLEFLNSLFVGLCVAFVVLCLMKTTMNLDLFVYRTPVGYLCYFTYFSRHRKFYAVFGRRPWVRFTTGLEV